MTTADNGSPIEPLHLGPDSRFKFRCHKEVKCFTKCCRGIHIVLTPYDVIRLKNRLQLSSDEFLATYTQPQILEKTDLPVVTLKLLDDGQSSCPFVREDGCMVYEDRPSTCRYYPLGVATLAYREGADESGFYFFVNEPHCRGFEEDRAWTIQQWRIDQGVDFHDQMNAEWTELIVRKRSFPPNMKWNQQTKQMFFTASYDIDKFKRFVFDSTFLDRYRIDAATRDTIRQDEVELLRFSLRWLKWLLFKEGDFASQNQAGPSEDAQP